MKEISYKNLVYFLTKLPPHEHTFTPPQTLKYIHIAGTKGKGSTAHFIQTILLKNTKHKIGLFTSPHMRSVRERIKINGKPISQEQFILHAKETWKQITGEELSEETITKAMQQPIVKRNKKTGKEASYFSFLTMIALNAFRWNQCHWAIIEVGIGGRYDFTNCISPVATAITPLGYDHMHMLGNTIEEIAWQKAGIFKDGIPAFTAPQVPQAMEVLEKEAKLKKTSLQICSPLPSHIRLGLDGAHQHTNASLAISVSEFLLPKVPRDALLDSLQYTHLPGRAQTVYLTPSLTISSITAPVRLFLDGAHTIESIHVATEWFLTKSTRSRVLIFHVTGSRERSQLEPKLHFEKRIYPTLETRKENPSNYSPNGGGDGEGTLEDALEACFALQKPVDVFVTGSLHLVGSMLEIIDYDCEV